jgi:trimeric autotransporter adhesin
MNNDLFKAILSMDAYNRGYNAEVNLGTNLSGNPDGSGPFSIGNATFFADSGILAESKANSFYAIAYTWNGKKIISYRGSDNEGDVWADLTVGLGGSHSTQVDLAFQFYNLIASNLSNTYPILPINSSISLTGHSLGGGLAGLVGSIYKNDVVIFDNMAFKDAAENLYKYSTYTFDNQIDEEKRSHVYSTGKPWKPDFFSKIKAYYLTGEGWFSGEPLNVNRQFQIPKPTGLSLGPDVLLPSRIDKHSISLFVIRKFADVTSIGEDWKAAAKYLFPPLFDENIAKNVVVDPNKYKGPGAGSLNAVMRDMIAYSAIDEGTRIFGDTAIRAMYNDANDLGKELSLQHVSKCIDSYAISSVLVQYAGQLAYGKVDQDVLSPAIRDQVLQGVVSRNSENSLLSISFDNNLWSFGGTGSEGIIVGRELLVNDAGRYFLRDGWTELFNGVIGNYNKISNITFVAVNDGTPVTAEKVSPTDKVSLVLGTESNDNITGSEGNDVICGGQGNDILRCSDGNDTLIGDEGNDTADYSCLTSGITVSGNTVTKSDNKGKDTLYGIEKIIGTKNADTFYGTSSDDYFAGNGGNDIFNISGSDVDTLVFDTSASQNATINGYSALDCLFIDNLRVCGGYQGGDGLYHQGSLLFTPDATGVTITDAGITVRINALGGGQSEGILTYGNITLLSTGTAHTLTGSVQKVDDNHANVYFTADTPGAIITGQATATIQKYVPDHYDGNGNLIWAYRNFDVPATNFLNASNNNLSADIISDIQNLNASGNVTLTDEQFNGFSKISGSGTLTVEGGGYISLAGKTLGSDSTFNLAAVGWEGATLIGNDQNYQTLTASALGDDTLIAGNGNNDVLRAGSGNCTLIGGNGNDSLYMGTGLGDYQGGAGDDTFYCTNSPETGSNIDGGTGSNTIDISSYHDWDLSGLTINNIQTLDVGYNDVTLTADQFAKFSTFFRTNSTIFVIGGGTFSLLTKSIDGMCDLHVTGEEDTTLIGNNTEWQHLTKTGGGNNTLITGNCKNNYLTIEGSGSGDATLVAGDGDGNHLSADTEGNASLTVGNGRSNVLTAENTRDATLVAGNGDGNHLYTYTPGNSFLSIGNGNRNYLQAGNDLTPNGDGDAILQAGNGDENYLITNTTGCTYLSVCDGNGNILWVEGTGSRDATLVAGDGDGNNLNANAAGNASLSVGNGSDNWLFIGGRGSGDVILIAGDGNNNNLWDGDDNGGNGTGNATLIVGNGNDNYLETGRDGNVYLSVGDGNSNEMYADGTGDATYVAGNGDNNYLLARKDGKVEMTVGDGNSNELYVAGGGFINGWTAVGTGEATLVAGDGDNNYLTSLTDGKVTMTVGNGECNSLYAYGTGKHYLTGGNGSDTLSSNLGVPIINAGGGDDTLCISMIDYYNAFHTLNNIFSADSVIDGGSGNNTLSLVGYQYSKNLKDICYDFSLATIKNISTLEVGVNVVLTAEQLAEVDTICRYKYGYGDTTTSWFLQAADAGTYDLTDKTVTGIFNLIGSTGDDILKGNVNTQFLAGGLGNDMYYVNSSKTKVNEKLNEGNDSICTSVSFILGGNIENLNLTGHAAINGTGDSGANTITGNDQKNTLTGLGGNDILDGGQSNDTMIGGLGNDTYYVDAAGDKVTEAAGQGTDTVFSSVSFTLGANVENLTLTGNADINGTGNTLSNIIVGNSGNNILNGASGKDTLVGNEGNDTYFIDAAGDVIIENADEGTDTVFSTITTTLGANLENLTLIGTAAINSTGNEFANTLTGNTGANILNGMAGNDTLDGGKGNDRMYGGLGDDTYYVDAIGDLAVENTGQGLDTVISSATYSLSANIENLTLSGTAAINGTGNDLDNILIGNSANNILNGGLGDDTLQGGQGNDTYLIDSFSDTILENLNEGTDTVISTIATTLGDNLENLTLAGTAPIGTGNDLDNTLIGNTADNTLTGLAGNDTLDGGLGNDTMAGGQGDDTYSIDAIDDTVVENTDEGFDTVISSISYTLGENVERLIFSGTQALSAVGDNDNNSLTGNTAGNTLTGLDGDDTLDGGKGYDTLIGGLGEDTYFVDATGDIITENPDEGMDTVFSSVAYTLGANLEKLTLTGTTAINGIGNALANTLTGNSAANILTGSAGNDTLNGLAGSDKMVGGQGDDTYYVDAAGDIITEIANDGTDTVYSSATYVLKANIESLILTGTSAINGTGNNQGNTINGNSGNNILDGGKGSDTMTGGLGNDTYIVDEASDMIMEDTPGGWDTVKSSASYILSDNLENLMLTGTLAVNGTGNGSDNWIQGNSGSNILTGGGGDDYLDGGTGNDTMIGGTGNDGYQINAAGDQVTEDADAGSDWVSSTVSYTLGNNLEILGLSGTTAINGTGNSLNNTLTGNSGSNILDGREGDDDLTGGAGNDTLYSRQGNDNLSGGVGNDFLDGGEGDDFLTGGAGNDTMVGGSGDDRYYIDTAGDKIIEKDGEGHDYVTSSISYTLAQYFEDLTLETDGGAINATGNNLDNIVAGNKSNNILDGKEGSDQMFGSHGNDTYIVGETGDIVDEYTWVYINDDSSGFPQGWYYVDAGGIDTVISSINYTLGSFLENLTLSGTSAQIGTGNELANILTGNNNSNILTGGAGNDTINGGLGNDALVGGLGDDAYYVDATGDVLTENADQGVDTVFSSVSHTLAANIENLTLTGTTAINATGNILNNTLTGNSGNNILIGDLGDDTYFVNAIGDVVTENTDEGIDTVFSSAAYALGANIENLTLSGTAAITGTGNDLNNFLTGNTGKNILTGLAGNDTLDGGKGIDTMKGGADDDTYYVDMTGDIVTESLNDGTDTVISTATYTLKANVDNLILMGTAAINGTGNEIKNTLTGNSAGNILNGGLGNDTMIGGLGNDTYYADTKEDIVTENLSGGTDTVISTTSYTLSDNVENLIISGTTAINGTGNALANILTGNSGNNTLIGLEGNDILNGGQGNDAMSGGLDDDTYYVNAKGDTVTEELEQGIDNVVSSITFTLGANVENLTLSGTTAINGTGNELNNALTGNAAANILTGLDGNDTLDGDKGNDKMVGGLGNDIYYVDSSGDTVVENLDEGIDAVISSLAYTLKANVENLTLGGALAINGIGNELSNTLTGNSAGNILTGLAGNDILDGGLGNDTMIGGLGDDTYYVDTLGDVVTEKAQEGNDTVISSFSYILTENIENLSLGGALAINGIGNELSNTLTGNSEGNMLTGLAGDDILDGMEGNDTLIGGLGDDTYYVDNASDVVTENADEGNDTVFSSFSSTLQDTIENLSLSGTTDLNGTGNGLDNILTGNSGNNILIGLAGDDTLDGNEGDDTLTGGLGDDTYHVDALGDTMTENADEGIDSVFSSITFSIEANIENLTLTGDAAINGTGNELNNTLAGNSGDNILTGLAGSDTLDGKAGNDTLIGGLGDDTYYLDTLGDLVTENLNEGTDIIYSTVTSTLGDNLENLVLTGYGAINATGNDLDNILTGNAGVNTLTGLAGDDILDGEQGNDTMIGGLGNDTYFVEAEGDTVTENVGEGNDTVKSSISYALGDNIENLTLTGSDSLDGIGNTLNNTITGNAGDNILQGEGGDDVFIGGLGDDTYVIDSASDIVMENPDEGDDSVFSSVSYSLGANVENLVLIGPDTINGIGNDLDNILMGNEVDNVLAGGNGNDVLVGGDGSDHFLFNTELNSSTNIDEIVDFTSGEDTMDLSLGIFSELGLEGTLSLDFFAAGDTGSALDENDYILYNTTSGALFYDADGNGAGVAIQFATLTSKPQTLMAADFTVLT